MPYNYSSDKTQLLKSLRNSCAHKKLWGWSRSSTGFTKNDVVEVKLSGKSAITVVTKDFTITDWVKEFSLSEIEELIKFVEGL